MFICGEALSLAWLCGTDRYRTCARDESQNGQVCSPASSCCRGSSVSCFKCSKVCHIWCIFYTLTGSQSRELGNPGEKAPSCCRGDVCASLLLSVEHRSQVLGKGKPALQAFPMFSASHRSPSHHHVFHSASCPGQLPSSPICWFGLSSPLGPARAPSKESMASALLPHPAPPSHPSYRLWTKEGGAGSGLSLGAAMWAHLSGCPYLQTTGQQEKVRWLAWHPWNG